MNLYRVDIEITSKASVQVQAGNEGEAIKKSKAQLVRKAAFDVGTQVEHPVFGVGTIKGMAAAGAVGRTGWIVTVDFGGERGTKDLVIMPGRTHLQPVGV